MARRARGRSGEGEGNQILVRFDLDNPQDYRAMLMARQLARKYGALSQVVRGFLLALADFQDATGVELNAEAVTGMFLSGVLIGNGRQVISSTYVVDGEEPEIVIGTATRATAQEIVENMDADMGNLFAD
jgi:hypothetical protein